MGMGSFPRNAAHDSEFTVSYRHVSHISCDTCVEEAVNILLANPSLRQSLYHQQPNKRQYSNSDPSTRPTVTLQKFLQPPLPPADPVYLQILTVQRPVALPRSAWQQVLQKLYVIFLYPWNQ